MSHALSAEDLSDKNCHVETCMINRESLCYHIEYGNQVGSHCSVAVMSLYSMAARERSRGKYGLGPYHSF